MKSLPILRFLCLSLLIVALARPQGLFFEQETHTEGVDIMIAMDVSGSMAAEDLNPNRLMVAKKMIQKFIQKRQHDRMGFVLFGGDAYTACPLTLDGDVLHRLLEDVGLNAAGDGTAIGMAIATAINRLKDSNAKSKLLILVTDGENNAGELDPMTASKLAHDYGVKIYTIGIGKEGGAPIPVIHPQYGKIYPRNPDGSPILTRLDDVLLKHIAETTGGLYFRAIDNASLEKVFAKIDGLEKVKIKSKEYNHYEEYFPYILSLAGLILILELSLRFIYLRILPL